MRYLTFWALALTLWSCQGDSMKMVELDLLKYGVPLTIKAPASAEVSQPYGEGEVWIVDTASYFKIQVVKVPTASLDVAELKSQELELVKAQEGFSKLIMEEAAGFVFEENYDKISYDFKYIAVSGNNKFVFQKLFTEMPTQDEAEKMYKAVKQ